MDNKVYVWLFNNISKYDFAGEEANQIKLAISRMLITNDSINSEAILTKMKDLYVKFCNMFYNNIFGYQNGLVGKSITAADLDCYFLQTSDGLIPIGYYRNIRPAETAAMVQAYLEQCKKDINTERNQTVARWQNGLDSISQKFDVIKNSKNPNVTKGVIGAVMSIIIIAIAILSIKQLNAFEVVLNWGNVDVIKNALNNIPIISEGNEVSWIVFLIFLLICIIIAILGVFYTVKEFRLIADKNVTQNILNNILVYVTKLEKEIAICIENTSAEIYDAARQGENIKVSKTPNATLSENVEMKIKKALEFVNKTEKRRVGIHISFMVLLAVIIALFPLAYSQSVADGISKIKIQNHRQNTQNTTSNNATATTNPTIKPTERPNGSTYTVYKSDASWLDAEKYAKNIGGHLVSINDREEFDKVCNLADQKNIKVFWVGACRETYETWENVSWLDGEDINFTNWFDGEPTYYSEDNDVEKYLMVFKVDGIWYFNDAINDVSQYYSDKMGYIVEKEE